MLDVVPVVGLPRPARLQEADLLGDHGVENIQGCDFDVEQVCHGLGSRCLS